MPLQLAGPNANQQFFTINAGASLTISGAISGTTGSQLTKEGTGTLFLNGNNSGFLGPVTIPNGQGIINAGNPDALGSPITSEVQAIALTGPGAGTTSFTLTFNGITTGNITYTGTPADPGTIQAALNALSTIGGAGGFVTVTAVGNVYTVTFGGALANLNVTPLSGTVSAGAGSIATAVLVNGGPTANVVTVGNNSQLQLNTLGGAITAANNSSPIVITSAANGLTTGQQVVIQGVGGNVAANGVWTITVINATHFSLNNSTGNGGYIGSGTWANLFTNALFLSGTGISNDGALLSESGNNGWAGNVQLVTDTTIGVNAPAFPVDTFLTITGVISDAGAGHSLTKAGSGSLLLTNANTYRGSTFVNFGGLNIENPLALGADPAAGVFVNSNFNDVEDGVLALAYVGGSSLPTANLQDYILQNPALPYNAATNPYVGFLVPNEQLFLFTDGSNGSLINFEGDNAWSGNIVLGPTLLGGGVFNAEAVTFNVGAFAGVNTSLLLTGVISDAANRPPSGAVGVFKLGTGNLILEPTNPSTANSFTPTVTTSGEPTNSIIGTGTANTFSDTVRIIAGTITMEDSQALGLSSKTDLVTVIAGASLHLQANVGHVDSVTASTTRLQVDVPISIGGTGSNGEGAIDSAAGINTYVANAGFNGPVIQLGAFGAANTDIGVVAEPFESDSNAYLTDDYSLTITGGISGGVADTLTKVGTGDLILPNANTAFTGPTMINGGWVTMRDPDALGSRLVATGNSGQTTVTVDSLASLQLLPLIPGTSFDFFHNLVLSGEGNLNTYSLIDNAGALINLGGDNTISGNVSLVGTPAIGVVQVFPDAPSQLTITGELSAQTVAAAGIPVAVTPSGGSQENDQIIDTGATSGSITINYNMFTIPDDLRVYYPPVGVPGSTRIFDTGLVSGSGTAVVNYGPGTSTTVEIIMDQGGGSSGTAWTYTAVIHPNVLTSSSGLIKLGDGRLVLDGPGDYSGGTDIRQGGDPGRQRHRAGHAPGHQHRRRGRRRHRNRPDRSAHQWRRSGRPANLEQSARPERLRRSDFRRCAALRRSRHRHRLGRPDHPEHEHLRRVPERPGRPKRRHDDVQRHRPGRDQPDRGRRSDHQRRRRSDHGPTLQ